MVHVANQWRNQNYRALSHADDRLKPSCSKWISIDENSTELSCTPPSTTTSKINSDAKNDGCSSQMKDCLKPPLTELIPLAKNLTKRSCTPPYTTHTNISLISPSSQLEDYLKPSRIPMTENSMDLLCTPASAHVSNIVTLGEGIDEKKWKRRISNRESARRSRIKREKHMKDLINEKSMLEMNLRENKHKFVALTERYRLVESENEVLRDKTAKLREYLNYLDEITRSCKEKGNNSEQPDLDRVCLNYRYTLSSTCI